MWKIRLFRLLIVLVAARLLTDILRSVLYPPYPSLDHQLGSFQYENVTDLPNTIDWRENGAVTPVNDQGPGCGSCWVFSAVACVEGIYQITTGKLVSLSQQQVLDCDTSNQDGCKSGYPQGAFEFIVRNRGLATEYFYPYTATSNGPCNVYANANLFAPIKGYGHVPANDEGALLKTVANQPVSASIRINKEMFRDYTGGIMTDEYCETNWFNLLFDLDEHHAVTVVGYGESEGKKYWLVKNSWGYLWGEHGYFRIERDVAAKQGACGIASDVWYPTMTTA